MKRTLNATGKVRLSQDHVWAEFTAEPTGKTVKVEWDLSGLSMPSGLEMIAEVFASDSIRETIGSDFNPKGFHIISLSDSLAEGLIRLTLRLVDTKDPLRRIAAETASIFLNSEESSSKSLLKTQPKSDLSTLWAIDFAIGEPVLQILNRGNSYRELTSSELFLSAILPSAVESITQLVITDQDSFNADALTSWEDFLGLLGLTSEELLEFRRQIEDSNAVEIFQTIRQRAQEVARVYSLSYKLTEVSLIAEEA